MRYLNKLVFINSATIPYAEVQVNGNVHLIGTQGVGKSTLLRAILFFYNADTLKLGISREKKTFAEYYFPYQNSFVVYEVMRETGAYCIIAFKSQGKVCYRFFDAGYDKKFFLSPDGQAFQKWEDSRQILDADNIFYTRKIDRYDEYRDILYGNTETGKKEFSRYALLQSRQYQNIPRTIQNVFLNSKLEAEFIKQTIIMSLNEEDIGIDLQNYSHHLGKFEEQIQDIHKYKQPAIQKLAENIVKYLLAIRYLEHEKHQLAQQLSWAVANVQRQIPKLQDRKEKAMADKEAVLQKMENAEARHRNKIGKIKGDISVLDNDLKKVKEKTEYYSRLHIEGLLDRVNKKKEHETVIRNMAKELELLTQKFGEISQKYDALLTAHDHGIRMYVQEKENEKLRLKAHFMEEEKAARKYLQQAISEIRQTNQDAEQQAIVFLEQQQQLLINEKLKREAIRHKIFFNEEITEIKQQALELTLSIQKATQQAQHFRSRQEMIQKQWELDEARVKQDTIRKAERLEEQLGILKEKSAGIHTKLANSADALYGWLNENTKGWEQTIGKVIDEHVLFSKELSPLKVKDELSLYGVKLELEDLPVKVKSLAAYEQELKQLAAAMEKLQAEQTELHAVQADQLDKLKKKYQPQIKECKDGWEEQQYIAERDSHQHRHYEIEKKDLELKAAEEKQKSMAQIDSAIAKAQELLLEAQQTVQAIKEEVVKQVKAKEKEFEKKSLALEKEEKAVLEKIDDEIRHFNIEGDKKRTLLVEARNNDMAGKGANTHRIATVEKQLEVLKKELEFIEKNRDVVAEYKKDKRELIDKAEEFKNKKQALEQQYDTEELKYRNQQANHKEELHLIESQVQDLHMQLRQAEEDHEAFTSFSLSASWNNINDAFKEEKDAFKTDKRCKAIIDDFNRCFHSIFQRWDELKDTTNKFLGNFSDSNLFSFKTNLSFNEEYLQFAEQLDEFISNRKIEEFEKRVNERFATIIHSVGKETANLMSKGGEIQKVINEINRDFDSKNFVTAIQKIELRLDESANTVVKLLLQIKHYNDEHAYDIGGMNLFSSIDQDAKNRKAVDLLKQLSKSISDHKKDTITLSDTFELKFRIEENFNDSGWVEKLSNVGSEGTDVLVKAMINIMLLNVFKEGASRKFKDFRLHCMMDEIGKLHPVNVKGILQFANDRNINLINGSPTETNALDYKHIYRLEKDSKRNTRIKRIITNLAMA